MPNLLLTQKCVRKCPYCFADKYMSESKAGMLAWDDYIYVLDFYERNRVDTVSLLGGEPTVHPDATQMMEYALLRGFHVRMFTSGIMPESTRQKIARVWEKYGGKLRTSFIVNVNHPSVTPEPQMRAQQAFLEMAGPRASISFNIYQPDFDLDFVFDYIARFNLGPVLRMGLTHPIAEAPESNSYVAPPSYRSVANNLARFFPKFDVCRVVPDFDCGFPVCMFTDEQLGQLLKLRASFHWTCGPIIDIGPDLELWPCFPLSHIRGKSLYDFDTLPEIQAYLVEQVAIRKKRNTGIYLECDECRLRERQLCSGGCVTYMLPEGSLD